MKKNIGSIVIALSVIIAAFAFANAYQNRNKGNNTISVTGLGSQDFVSDLIVWDGSFSSKNMNLKDAYSDLDNKRETIKSYLISNGIKENEIIFSAISVNEEYDNEYDKEGWKVIKSTFTGYRLQQDVQIESNAVDKVEAVSREISELIKMGVSLNSELPRYYYTKLTELKIKMIEEATKDANLRAKKIAENAGSNVGRLKSANLGVFQIVAQNSSEEYSWGGSFNTSSKRKTATITVRLEYEVR
ncbi:MAG: SIMPL domain-containing protein [Bacteroidetes bacterium]|nr:SIMPL domain-containing protein [Bacteroidota bacterium]